MKKKLLHLAGLAAFVLIAAISLHAANTNTTNLSGPAYGNNKLLYNGTATGAARQGFQGVLALGDGDCAPGVSGFATSASSTAVNLTSTAGLSPSATTPYAGNFVIKVTNASASASVVFFANMTATSITSANPAGDVIKPLESRAIIVQARDGITGHFQGLTGPASYAYSICNQ